jgi:tetratricopeptide (TPR) repeat protein
MLDCQLFGMDSGRHHLVNLLFHIINTLLLFFVFKQMTGSLWKSSFVAALFALHPLHVESVAWISERKDVLSTFFWMLAMLSYLRYVRRPVFISYFFVVLFFSLGLMSKPMVITLPFVFLLIDYWPLNRFRSQPMSMTNKRGLFFRLVWEKVPLFILSLISCFLTFYAQNHGGAVVSLVTIPIKARIANAIVSYATYIWKILYPFELALYYPFVTLPPLWEITIASMFLIFISFLAVKNSIKHPYAIIGWLWFLGTLVPVIGFVQVGLQSMADRYTYLPSIGLFMIVAYGFPELVARWQKKKIIISISATTVLVILMAITYTQVGYWKNSITLFEHTLKVTSRNRIIQFNLGNTLVSQGRPEEAIPHYLEAVKIYPDYLEARFNLGITLYNTGHTQDAIKQYLKVISIKPDLVEAYNYLGLAFLKGKNIDKAVVCFQKALKINPNYIMASNNLKNALMMKQKYQFERGSHEMGKTP